MKLVQISDSYSSVKSRLTKSKGLGQVYKECETVCIEIREDLGQNKFFSDLMRVTFSRVEMRFFYKRVAFRFPSEREAFSSVFKVGKARTLKVANKYGLELEKLLNSLASLVGGGYTVVTVSNDGKSIPTILVNFGYEYDMYTVKTSLCSSEFKALIKSLFEN